MSISTDSTRLVADIGGTNARFAMLDEQGQPVAMRVLPCADYPSLTDAINAYLAQSGQARPTSAVIAVATFTNQDQIKMTNHVWSFSVAQTRTQLSLERLHCINDFTALALALLHLPPSDLRQVGGKEPTGSGGAMGLLGPGTGLGVSGLLHTPQGWYPLQGEGGHISYGPMTELEQTVWTFVQGMRGHVSAESLLSGQGLVNIYLALRDAQDNHAESLQNAAQITERGLTGQCGLCVQTLALFCQILGTVAGNLALTLGAKNGIFIGGGIIPRLGNFIDRSDFRKRFEERGRFTDYLRAIPVYIITAEAPALIGSAQAFEPFYADIGVSSER